MFGVKFNSDEINENIETMLAFGVVKSIDYANATAIVEIDEIETPPIEWLTSAGALNIFAPPSIGEQVLVASINGNLAQAVILGGVYSNANPAAANSQKVKIIYQGIEFELSNGIVSIKAQSINFEGDLNVTGSVNATNDVVADGKSLKSHRHGLVKVGTDISGQPQ